MGEFFVGYNKRLSVSPLPSGDTFYALVKTGSKYVVVEDVTQTLDFSSVTDGRFKHTVDAYVGGSATSSFTYTPANPTPAGRSMASHHINDLPEATIDLGIVASETGDAEYKLFDTTFYIDTGGNRNTVNQSGNDFFAKGRQIVLAPNAEMLIVAKTTGDAVGSADITTTFFFSEIPVDQFPVLSGYVA